MEEIRERLIKLAHRWVHCPDDAEDLVQDTLIAYYQRHHLWPSESYFPNQAIGWCVRKLHSLVIDQSRHKCRHDIPLYSLDSSESGQDIFNTLLEDIFYEEFLHQLPQHLSTVLVLLLKGYSCEEIAQQMSVPSARIRHYKRQIRQLFKQFASDPEPTPSTP